MCKQPRKIAHEILPKILFEEEYIKNGKSYKELAIKYNLGQSSIGRLMKKYNIQPKPRQRPAAKIIGKIYGHLTVIKRSENKKIYNNSIWECRCDCGNLTYVSYSQLHSKKTQSCGCYRRGDKHKWWRGYKEINGSFFKRVYNNAKKRNFEFSITIEFAWNLFLKQDRKCALSGVEIIFTNYASGDTTASLDRIDNTKGYTEDNVQWVHKDINWMKQDFEQTYFIEMCKNVTKNN